ncbi:MAG: site-2 protease family protein [Patescibacteria group bacterium]
MTIILFLIVLAVLILVHEFGHFYAAKKCGVRVDEFGLGFPPKIWSWKRGETVYSLNAVPFGGFVKIFGENPDSESISGPDRARSFVNKPRWKQAVILSAGVVMNILFAWILFGIAFASGMTTAVSENNSKYITDSHVIVVDILPNSPAGRAGLFSGDEILSIKTSESVIVAGDIVSVQDTIKNSNGKKITLEIQHLAGKKIVEVTPERGVLGENYAIGISMDLVGKVKLPVYLAFWEGAKLTVYMLKNIVVGIYMLIYNAAIGQGDISQISGPIGIARLVGDAGRLGFVYLLSFTAFISLNLAVLNLIPFPALDGGRILFVGIEAIRRKMISPRVANTVNAVGFGILILFMLFVTYRDVVKLF